MPDFESKRIRVFSFICILPFYIHFRTGIRDCVSSEDINIHRKMIKSEKSQTSLSNEVCDFSNLIIFLV